MQRGALDILRGCSHVIISIKDFYSIYTHFLVLKIKTKKNYRDSVHLPCNFHSVIKTLFNRELFGLVLTYLISFRLAWVIDCANSQYWMFHRQYGLEHETKKMLFLSLTFGKRIRFQLEYKR